MKDEINKIYITIEEEEIYFQEIYDETIGNVEKAMFLTPNYLSYISEEANIKSDMAKTFEIDHDVISKMASIDIASGGIIPLPEKGESVNVRFLGPPRKIGKTYMARCAIYGREYDLQYDIPILSTMAKGIFAEFQKAKIPIDDELKCIVGRIFTVAGREWSAPRGLWKIDDVTRRPYAPKVLVMALRLDLEAKMASSSEEGKEYSGHDLMTF